MNTQKMNKLGFSTFKESNPSAYSGFDNKILHHIIFKPTNI